MVNEGWASEGPSFVATIVKVSDWPATASPVCVFVRIRSTSATTFTVEDAVLSAWFVSVVWVETSAVLVRIVPSGTDADTRATTLMIEVPGGSRRSRVHVSSWPAALHAQPLSPPLSET